MTGKADEEKRAIEAVWHRAIEALATGDWEAYSDLWVHEPYVQAVHSGTGSWWTGWEEVGARYGQIVGRGIPVRAETSRMDVHVSPSGDMAWAAMETEVRTGKKGHRQAWQVVGFEKKDGRWRMALAFDAPRRGRK